MTAQPRRVLSLFDSACIIVGIIIGAGIYETAPTVASCMGSASGVLLIWLAGGVLALAGALCYAELATTYPRAGGDYVYLTRAYGRMPGFLFGWSQLAIVRPGDIALLAFVFARYATRLWTPDGAQTHLPIWAGSLVLVLTVANIIGVKSGKWTQNILTVLKAIGLLVIVGVGLFGAGNAAAPTPLAAPGAAGTNVKLALILVLFTYGGWNEMAYVAAEVKQPRRNIVRALVLGTVAVAALYELTNGAFLRALGYEGMSSSQAVAVDAVTSVVGKVAAGKMIAVLICISAAGAVNGLIFTGGRMSYALGGEHAAFGALGSWSQRTGTPVRALTVQGSVSLAIVLFIGSFIDTIIYAAPVVWLFFLGTALSLFILRRREPDTERPYRVVGYPVVPLVFVGCCVFMLYSSLGYASAVRPTALLVMTTALAAGVPVYALSRLLERGRE